MGYREPGYVRTREAVSEALRKLTRLLLFLMDRWLGVRRPVSGMFYSYFDEIAKSSLSGSEILVANDEDAFNPAHETRADAGLENALALNTRHAPDLSEPGRQVALGSKTATDLQDLRNIAGFVLARGYNLISCHTPEVELTLESIDRLEVQVGVQLANVQEPKYRFDA